MHDWEQLLIYADGAGNTDSDSWLTIPFSGHKTKTIVDCGSSCSHSSAIGPKHHSPLIQLFHPIAHVIFSYGTRWAKESCEGMCVTGMVQQLPVWNQGHLCESTKHVAGVFLFVCLLCFVISLSLLSSKQLWGHFRFQISKPHIHRRVFKDRNLGEIVYTLGPSLCVGGH